MKTFDVLRTPLAATDYESFAQFCRDLAAKDGTVAIDLSNTQVITMRRHDPQFRALTACFDFFVPDGMPLIWCMNAEGAALRDRVYGPTFMRRCIVGSPTSTTHYLLGASDKTLTRLQHRLLLEQPDLKIIGSHDGYFAPDDEEAIVEEINRLSPDFIWVGLGTPKQQEWIHRNKPRIRRGVIFAVGFAFDVNAGTKKDAPAWMQRRGLTWLFRALTEPRRLLGRYLKYNTLFLFYLGKDALYP